MFGECRQHDRKRVAEWQRYMVGERARGGTGATLTAIDCHEVGSPAAGGHVRAQLMPKRLLANRGFDTDGEAGLGCYQFDEVDQTGDVVEFCVSTRAVDGDPDGYSTGGGDLLGDLGGRKHTTETGLRPLTEFDLDRLDWRKSGGFDDPLDREFSGRVARSEVAGADLEDEFPAMSVVNADTSLAGVLHASGKGDAPVDCFDGRSGK